jgi:predicted P-loop ATPase
MQAIGKTPSIYNRDHKVVGFPKWTDYHATLQAVEHWKSQPDLGICLQARAVRAFDIDDGSCSEKIADAIMGVVGPLPVRIRGDRLLLAFRYTAPLTKRVIPTAGGIIEVLADGQQFVAAGTHPSGEPYRWSPTLPDAIPELSEEQFTKVWNMLVAMFATGDPKIARERRKGTADLDLKVHDDVADWLLENWETYDVGSDGQVYIQCPFEGEHSADSGPTATAYFPAGTGGFERGHFVCLHAHCNGREDRDYLDASGYSVAQFEDISGQPQHPDDGRLAVDARAVDRRADGGTADPTVHGLAGRAEAGSLRGLLGEGEEAEWPRLKRNQKGEIDASADNLTRAIGSMRIAGRRIVYDRFTDGLLWAYPEELDGPNTKWRRFSDADTVGVRIALERLRFKPMSRELFRDCIAAAAAQHSIDTARDWLVGLRWDGVRRLESFAIACWGWQDSPYSRAVGRYVWTALAGRVLQPGVRADMVPILVGAQGIKKTTLIQSMAPNEDFYTEIKLDEQDSDVSRKLRGKLVGELEELRGLNSRAIEEIKAFVTRRRESWVPKFKEFENFFWRRCIFFGTTNETGFLADPTGERRWLPGKCGRIDVELLLEWRDQLWAEGAAMFALDGVDWQDAERLAGAEHRKFKINDTWETRIADWLVDDATIDGKRPLDKGYVTTSEVMLQALSLPVVQQNRVHEQRVTRALQHLGLKIGFELIDGREVPVYQK